MSLLHQIQESVIQEGCDLGSVLLKLRLLASKLGSNVLEEWVKHESEGYPQDAVAVRKVDAPAADQAAINNVGAVAPFSGGGGLIQTTSG